VRILLTTVVLATILWGCGNSDVSRLAGQGNSYTRADYLLDRAERMPGAHTAGRAANAFKSIRGNPYGEWLEYGYDEEAAAVRGNPQALDFNPGYRYHCRICWR